jgi:hypothetical protein
MNSNKEPDKIFDIGVSVYDDSGLYIDIITGENFGCIHFHDKGNALNLIENTNKTIK